MQNLLVVTVDLSTFNSQNNTNDAALNTSDPQHQLHNSSEPLPGSGSRNAAQTQDYSPANIEDVFF
jgi:hypothetical protein